MPYTNHKKLKSLDGCLKGTWSINGGELSPVMIFRRYETQSTAKVGNEIHDYRDKHIMNYLAHNELHKQEALLMISFYYKVNYGFATAVTPCSIVFHYAIMQVISKQITYTTDKNSTTR